MPIATVTFRELHQDSQDYASDDEHMVSRVFFDLEIGGRSWVGLHADLKQTVGSNIEADPIEVTAPAGYNGPMNHAAFSAAAEAYFRSLVGASGTGIRIQNSSNIRMRNNRYRKTATATFDVPDAGGSW